MHKISTCLIGEDSLLIQCGEILLNRNHNIAAVFSTVKKIQNWARKNNILIIENIEELIRNDIFDYIFSIVNSHFLSDSILNLPRYGAINYHDSLLPQYPGLYATSWAIINNEKKHGVTWHLMNNKIDQGDILKQCTFPILENDTAFTLNLRCYESAIMSFKELLIDIENCQLIPVKQCITKQTRRIKELPNYGFIDWKIFSAEKIDSICRGLTFGHYDNHVGTLKLVTDDTYFIISRVEVDKTHSIQKHEPGTVFLTEDSIYVSTITYGLKIIELLSSTGKRIGIYDFIKNFNIRKGYRFDDITNEYKNVLKTTYNSLMKNEVVWKNALLQLTEHATFINKGTTLPALVAADCDINLRRIYPNKNLEKTSVILAATILTYLYRLNNHENISVFLTCKNFHERNHKCANFTAKYLPFIFKPNESISLKETLNYVDQELYDIAKKQSYFTDILSRNPTLEGKDIQNTIIINLHNHIDTLTLPKECILYFAINEEKGTIQVYHRFDFSSQLAIREIFVNISLHITNILISIIERSHISINNFSFLMDHERYKLLRKLGQGENKTLPITSIIAIFKKNVELYPNNIAIKMDGISISYYELWQLSEKISKFIIMKNIHNQTLIGICLDRNIDMIIHILGILKAGAVYVPLDTKYPLHRIEHIVYESNLKYIFVDEKRLPKLNDYFQGKDTHINLFTKKDILNNNISNSDEKVTDFTNYNERLAYVIFTSGTTGKPKGVMVSHRNIINYSSWIIDTTYCNTDSVFDFSSSLAFDISIPCTLTTLLAGGTIAICDENTKTNPLKYLTHLKQNKVTHIEMTPGYLNLALNYENEIKDLKDLKFLLLGADVISKSDTIKFSSLCPHTKIINEYGPTETTVAITSYFINDTLPDSSVPIGKPGYNTQCYILDKFKNLCPIGMTGELHVGGEQVSKGYINNSDLTQEKFITLNFNKNRELLYKTGDLTCWLPDGNLQFHGRNDQQVKIHGYRVELSEIESALTAMPGIKQALVLENKERLVNNYLRAYLCCDKIFYFDDEIKKALSIQLPYYMIPKEYCIIDHLPLKDNEKIDYDSLKNKKLTLLTSKETNTKNINFDSTILHIWRNIFHDESVSLTDNFFDIGGDSLIALQIIDEIKKHYAFELPLRYLFEYPTVALLADKIASVYNFNKRLPTISHKKPKSIIQLSKGNYKYPIFLIHPVGGTVFWYKKLASLLEGKYTIYGIQDPNVDKRIIDFKSIEEMASYYINEIKSVWSGNHYCLGGASFGATVAFEMANQLIQEHKIIHFLGLFDGWASYPHDIIINHSLNLINNKDILTNEITDKRKNILKEIENHRKKLLLKYISPKINVNAVLYKAIDLWPFFKKIDDIFNGWKPYIKGKINVWMTPGDHETIFFDNNVKKLATQVDKTFLSLEKFKKINSIK